MPARLAGLVLTVIVGTPVQAQHWALTTVSKDHNMYTDLERIDSVAPHVYQAWSKYVYRAPAEGGDAEGVVLKEYDCKRGTRRVLSAVFYDTAQAVTWESKKPGPSTPVTRHKGRRQWLQVCNRVEGGVLGNLMNWVKITMRGSTS
jgi:hypothetical protein